MKIILKLQLNFCAVKYTILYLICILFHTDQCFFCCTSGKLKTNCEMSVEVFYCCHISATSLFKLWQRQKKGAVHKRCRNCFGHFWYPPPPCRNFHPDLPKFYPLISCYIGIWDNPPPKIFRRLLCMAPNFNRHLVFGSCFLVVSWYIKYKISREIVGR